MRNARTLHEKFRLAMHMCSRGLFEAAHKGLTTATVVVKGDTVGYVDHAPAAEHRSSPRRLPLELGSAGKRVPGHSAKAGTVVREMSAG
ncbi:hypothetical protein [Streptomyces sp. SID12501]|uniref:Uncharacterized protein n=1 Tax=Streptomyces sp. SID12501 TaxID=2706042 RepID=A0A6B3BYQ2_9ACTN|nr:hypothetical protein [Streptomyces sp. SID12501]NEC89505.1 hypothetical protein [Streptomyces sp. SID12501]